MMDDQKEKIIEQLRSRHRQQRRELDEQVLHDNAHKLSDAVTTLPEYQTAIHIAAYFAILGEISVEAIIHKACEAGKTCYLPILDGQSMAFAPWQPGAPLVKKKFGLLEPDCSKCDWIDPSELDLVLTPLVVFDHACNRIGQGGGFYDRTFEFTRTTEKPVLIGVAHDNQREPALSPQPWDISLHKIVTEKAIYSN